jgi:hypothetical protein
MGGWKLYRKWCGVRSLPDLTSDDALSFVLQHCNIIIINYTSLYLSWDA